MRTDRKTILKRGWNLPEKAVKMVLQSTVKGNKKRNAGKEKGRQHLREDQVRLYQNQVAKSVSQSILER